MKDWIIGISITLLVIGGVIGLSYGFGWIGVHQTKTIFKAKEDARREVFEQTQSYVEGKRQEALKLYKEYLNASDDEKEAIKEIVSLSFANFDEEKLNGKLKTFVYNCKYN
jgi:hypothetical protein